MKRNPTIHISRSDFEDICSQLSISIDVNEFFHKARLYNITDRIIFNTNKKTKTRADKLLNTDQQVTETFNKLLTTIRYEYKHKGIVNILKGTMQYTVLTNVAMKCHKFAEDFNFKPIEEGYKVYIKTGIEYMKNKYSLTRFNYYNDRIYKSYENYLLISQDDNKEATNMFYKSWQEYMLKYAYVDMVLDTPDNYVHMIFGRMEADKYGAKYNEWVESQFEGLATIGILPEFGAFYSEKAVNRYAQFKNTKIEVKEKQPKLSESQKKYLDLIEKAKQKRKK